jgi:diguanylate cyclase (GGDEF)-like protein
MTGAKLPGWIAAAMASTVLVLVLTVATSVAWMTRAMDDQSRRHAEERVRTALSDVLQQTRAVTLDFAKWDEAARRVAAADAAWLHGKIGTTAVTGDLVQLAVVWGGSFDHNLGWTDTGGTSARSGVLDPAVIELAESGLAGLPLDAYRGISFFTWRGGEVFALSAARIEGPPGSAPLAVADQDRGRIALGRRLDVALVRRIGAGVMLDGLRIVRTKPNSQPSLPLMGGNGVPIAHLAWDPQLAGTTLLRRMLPLLALVTAVATCLVVGTMALVRRGASRLVLAEQRSSRSARTDGLTGLPNRLAFAEALAKPSRAGQRAILFLDVNGFKRINDCLGHEAGDVAIKQLAHRLVPLGGPDCLLARIGGDEFVFVLSSIEAEFQAERLAHAIGQVMRAPFSIQGQQLHLNGAIGYAVQATNLESGDSLVRQADIAMYEAKRQKAGPVAFGEMLSQADRHAKAIERALRAVLTDRSEHRDELSIAYQPIVDLTTGRMMRAEALARWTSPELGVVPPDRFIGVAEQSGLMGELGQHLLALICDDLAAQPELHVSLNVSPVQLTTPTFVPDLVAELARRRIDVARVAVELTEAVVVDDARLAASRLAELRAAGISTALDDFGTGYSSIGYLGAMPFDTLKIDRKFVSGIDTSAKQLGLLNAMILMAHHLDLRVVCEGVETRAEMNLLHELGCDMVQGYHLDRPLPLQALVARWLHTDTHAEVA